MIERLRSEIAAAGGWIPFARYMELALGAYYGRSDRQFGARGDFVTAPELGRLFGRTLANQLRELGGPILELGAEEYAKLGVEGSLNCVGCWSPGRTMGLDCDFSCMISPRDFQEIFLPPLLETMATVDHRIYHLDGPGAIPHLERLLSIPELQTIQWVPGAGSEAIRTPLEGRSKRGGINPNFASAVGRSLPGVKTFVCSHEPT